MDIDMDDNLQSSSFLDETTGMMYAGKKKLVNKSGKKSHVKKKS